MSEHPLLRGALALVLGVCSTTPWLACSSEAPAPSMPVGPADTGTTAADSGGAPDVPNDLGADVGVDAAPSAICATLPSGVPTEVVLPAAPPAGGVRLAAITGDELTIVWTTRVGSVVTLHEADRESREAPFTVARDLPSALGAVADDSVGLSGDGLTMIVAAADHRGLRKLTRVARSEAFALYDDPEVFARLFAGPSEGTGAPSWGDPVLSSDGTQLFLTALHRTSGGSIAMSTRSPDETWDAPVVYGATALAVVSGKHRRPSGISSDGRALFFVDEVLGSSGVAFRSSASGAFDTVSGLGVGAAGAAPSTSCDRLYVCERLATPKGDAGPAIETFAIFQLR